MNGMIWACFGLGILVVQFVVDFLALVADREQRGFLRANHVDDFHSHAGFLGMTWGYFPGVMTEFCLLMKACLIPRILFGGVALFL